MYKWRTSDNEENTVLRLDKLINNDHCSTLEDVKKYEMAFNSGNTEI